MNWLYRPISNQHDDDDGTVWLFACFFASSLFIVPTWPCPAHGHCRNARRHACNCAVVPLNLLVAVIEGWHPPPRWPAKATAPTVITTRAAVADDIVDGYHYKTLHQIDHGMVKKLHGQMPRWLININSKFICDLFVIYLYIIFHLQDSSLQNKVLVHILTCPDNECEANIPQVVKDLVKLIGRDFFLWGCWFR